MRSEAIYCVLIPILPLLTVLTTPPKVKAKQTGPTPRKRKKRRDEDEEADDLRNKFPRYDEKEDLDLAGEDPVEFDSLEVRLHPGESDPGAGIKFVWYDGSSSLQQGKDWGKDIRKHDENNASGMRYKNLVPTFY